MSYSLIAENKTAIDWGKIHTSIFARGMSIEITPIPGDNAKNEDALGLSIPQKLIGVKSVGELKYIVLILEKEFNMRIFDMYSGAEVNSNNIDELVNQLLE